MMESAVWWQEFILFKAKPAWTWISEYLKMKSSKLYVRFILFKRKENGRNMCEGDERFESFLTIWHRFLRLMLRHQWFSGCILRALGQITQKLFKTQFKILVTYREENLLICNYMVNHSLCMSMNCNLSMSSYQNTISKHPIVNYRKSIKIQK